MLYDVLISLQSLLAAEVVVSPPYVFLPVVKSQLRPEIQVAAQNCWVKKGGAFTGEVRSVLDFLLAHTAPYVVVATEELTSNA
jgi:triosephosphate isomerase (TIM)